LRGLVLNCASTHQTENPQGFSEVGENKQLLIAIVAYSIFTSNQEHLVGIILHVYQKFATKYYWTLVQNIVFKWQQIAPAYIAFTTSMWLSTVVNGLLIASSR